ncbi:MAG: NUDIX domain-containing protein [Chloroflexi bacterium]|nr:NUDIX domain-containing protein [Chloroflexota bacterium]
MRFVAVATGQFIILKLIYPEALLDPKTQTTVLHGKRITLQGQLRLGCSTVLLDETGTRVLLTRRADNDLWCLPGGRVDAGESVAESVERECFEETGLRVRVKRLTGVYSDPDQLVVYPDGNKVHIVVLNFLVEQVSGEISLSSETTDIRYFSVEEAVKMDLFHNHAEHLRDALSGREAAFVK